MKGKRKSVHRDNAPRNESADIEKNLDAALEFATQDPNRSREIALDAMQLLEDLCDADSLKLKAKSSLVLSECAYLQSRFEEGLSSAKKACDFFTAINDRDGIATSLTYCGNFYEKLSDFSNALAAHQESLKIRREMGDKSRIASSLNNLGIAYSRLGNLQKALEFYQESLRIKQEVNDQKGVANALNNIGNVYYSLQDYKHSLEAHNKALNIRRNLNDKFGIANSLNNIGNVYHVTRALDSALQHHRESLQIRRELNDKLGMADSLNNIGNVMADLGDCFSSLQHHLESLSIRESIGDKLGEAKSLFNIAAVKQQLGDFENAEVILKSSLAICDNIADKELKVECLKKLCELYAYAKNYELAYATRLQHDILREEVFNFELQAMVSRIQIEHEVESLRKQAEYERREAELLRKKNQELESLLLENRRLQNLVTMCAWSGKIEIEGEWVRIEEYLRRKFGIQVTHGIAPDIAESLLKDIKK